MYKIVFYWANEASRPAERSSFNAIETRSSTERNSLLELKEFSWHVLEFRWVLRIRNLTIVFSYLPSLLLKKKDEW